MEQDGHFLRTQSWNSQHLDHTARDLLPQFFQLRNLSRFDSDFDLAGEVLANPVERLQSGALFPQQIGDGNRQAFQRASTAAVGSDTKGVRPLNLEQVRDFIEHGGYLLILHGFGSNEWVTVLPYGFLQCSENGGAHCDVIYRSGEVSATGITPTSPGCMLPQFSEVISRDEHKLFASLV